MNINGHNNKIMVLELLRTISVLSVLTFHVNPTIWPNGFLGVDIFFVISGYLMMHHSLSITDKFSIWNFLWRRFVRLAPITLVTIIGSLAFIYRENIPFLFQEYIETAYQALFFHSNIGLWSGTGYFTAEQKYNPFLHTWSLGVEAQFYICFAIAFAIVVQLKKTVQALILTITTLLSLILFCLYFEASPSATFYLLPTRYWQFGFGMLAAYLLIHTGLGRRVGEKLTFAFMVIIILTLVNIMAFAHSSMYSHITVTILSAVIIYLCHRSKMKIPFSKGFELVGQHSFTLYMVHYPIIVWFDDKNPLII